MITTINRPLTVSDDPTVRIAAAAQWLDGWYPGWAEKVDLDAFNMGCSEICLGHYLGVHWLEKLYPTHEAETGNSSIGLFSDYTNLWRVEITSRRV